MSKRIKKMQADIEVVPETVEAGVYEVVGVVPGIVHWGNDGSNPKIAWRDWDLRNISDAQKKLLVDNGFPYLERK